MIRVVVVDDEALIRSGLALILRAAGDIDVVAAVSGADAVREIGLTRPDVVLLDIRMPDVDGLTVLAQLRAMADPPIIAMLTTFDSDEYVGTALRSGAAGFLLKDTDPEQLAHSVRALAAGAVVLSAKAARPILSSHAGRAGRASAANELNVLTDRERDVLLLVAQGLSNADIGGRLFLSASTVKDHVSAILSKLGMESRVQAALLAQRAGLVTGQLSGQRGEP
ncbi:response regulator [Pseudonocardia acaciae]|uniref:response regulator n=1 Tax=Pseudonocardia acaciae TaxID=551276 RepID=UPI000566B561|nr:response regulator transcription factor [Pseudonocardia acaciae]